MRRRSPRYRLGTPAQVTLGVTLTGLLLINPGAQRPSNSELRSVQTDSRLHPLSHPRVKTSHPNPRQVP